MTDKLLSLSDKIKFGKYKGYSIEDILADDPSYLEWAIDEIDWFELDDIATQELNNELGYNNPLDNIV